MRSTNLFSMLTTQTQLNRLPSTAILLCFCSPHLRRSGQKLARQISVGHRTTSIVVSSAQCLVITALKWRLQRLCSSSGQDRGWSSGLGVPYMFFPNEQIPEWSDALIHHGWAPVTVKFGSKALAGTRFFHSSCLRPARVTPSPPVYSMTMHEHWCPLRHLMCKDFRSCTSRCW